MPGTSDFACYLGPERRSRVTYVTRNTEYHTAAGVCVAVRDRASGRWLLCHAALRRRLSGAVRPGAGGKPEPALAAPSVGDRLFFDSGSPLSSDARTPAGAGGRTGSGRRAEGDDPESVLTSLLLSICRPERATVGAYPV